MVIFGTVGQGLKQFIELGTAFLLSALIGLEREVRRKSAGLRTYAVVGTTAALSACLQVWLHRRTYSWSGRPRPLSCRSSDRYRHRLHRSWADLRKRDRVNGLTTAATIWLVTGVGMACGAGLLLLAAAVTAATL
jgi:putative Mg2+ transporter-C (MgtC) family protein